MSNKGCVKVNCIQCPECKDIIYSRARHDYHGCTCGKVQIDGGFCYLKFGWNPSIPRPKPFKKFIKSSKFNLYADWNLMKNKFGTIKEKK